MHNRYRGFLLSLAGLFLSQALLFSQSRDREVSYNAAWAEKSFGELQTADSRGGRLTVVKEEIPGDTQKNKSSGGSPLQLGQKFYSHGLGVSAGTILHVEVGKPAARFTADVGVDRFVDSIYSSVRFGVEAEGKRIFSTEYLKTTDGARRIDVPLNGATSFNLIVEIAPGSTGFNRSDWADARIKLQDGAELLLDEIADDWQVGTELPFSFVLGGKPSRDFLPRWKREVKTESIDEKRTRRTITLQDPETSLEFRAVAIIYRDTPGVDWTVYLTNRGDKDSPIIEKLYALDVAIQPGIGTAPILYRLRGSNAEVNDWVPYQDSLKRGQKIEFSPTNGKSSQTVSPFFNLQFGGGGVITAIGWSGTWSASTEWTKEGRLQVQAGLPNLHLKLHPGESIRGPRVMQMYWFGNDTVRSYNLFRHTMFSHIMPRIDGKLVVPPIVQTSTAIYEQNDGTEKDVLEYLNSVKDLGFEMLWLDAYWTKQGFPEGMGNYGFPIERAEPADRFPHGLKPVADATHKAGMGFVVWFEPERVYKGSYLYKEHPEWVIEPPVVCTQCILPTKLSFLFNLGIPEAREYMTKYLNTVIRAYGMDVLRIDYNINPTVYWNYLDTDPDRKGLTEIRYVEGLYRMWDDILAANPHLFIDNCASGGMRIDLETSARSIPLWRTDATIDPMTRLDFNQAALQNQTMSAGLSRYIPFNTSGQMGTSPYLFRSAYNAGIVFNEDTRPKDYPHEQLKQAVTEGNRIRKYFFGNFYPLTEVTISPEDWNVTQYHRTEESDGMILAFRRHQSPYGDFTVALSEIDPQGRYEVSFYPTYSAGKKLTLSGEELRKLRLEIDERPGSLLIEYKKISK